MNNEAIKKFLRDSLVSFEEQEKKQEAEDKPARTDDLNIPSVDELLAANPLPDLPEIKLKDVTSELQQKLEDLQAEHGEQTDCVLGFRVVLKPGMEPKFEHCFFGMPDVSHEEQSTPARMKSAYLVVVPAASA